MADAPFPVPDSLNAAFTSAILTGELTEQYGLGVLVWSPLASGWLGSAWRGGRDEN